VITNAYVQESVAGIEGGASVFEFLMNIKVPSPNLVPDSVFYQGMGTKLILKDTDQYYGRTSMKVTDLKTEKKLTVKMIFNGDIISLSPEYKVMDKMYMP
jgi:chemotaxis receptor (MCP) glutamine deamidase CheD